MVSTKSGQVYERRLILKYITDSGTDPITGEKLEEADLITVKASEFTHYHDAFVLLEMFYTTFEQYSVEAKYHALPDTRLTHSPRSQNNRTAPTHPNINPCSPPHSAE